jgi:pyruvate formate lyase activating enzyme
MPQKCIGCGACIEKCPNGAISRSDGRIVFNRHLCTDCGACVEVCYPQARVMSGREMRVDQVISEALKDRKFYESSGGGITLSGGEATMQWRFSAAIMETAKEVYLHTAVETTGYSAWEHLWEIAKNTDLILYDLKQMNSEKHREYTGVGNEIILENLKKLANKGKQIIIRIPLIPGVNDDRQNLEATARFVRETGRISEVHVLPYHQLGISKYPTVGYSYSLPGLKPPGKDATRKAEQIFQKYDFQVKMNG